MLNALKTLFRPLKIYRPIAARHGKRIAVLPLIFLLTFLAGCAVQSRTVIKNGEIFVYSEPETKAQIKLDGKITGKTTDTVLKNIPPGHHLLALQKKNDTSPGLPLIGAADFDLKPGQKMRVTVQLNVMAIRPRQENSRAIVAETEGQKTILDFYQAINNKDYMTAYGLLSSKQKQSYSSSLKNFIKNWQNVNKVTVTALSVKKSADQNSKNEVDLVGLDIAFMPQNPPKNPQTTAATSGTALQAILAQPGENDWQITTTGDSKDPGAVWQLDGIEKAQ